MKKIFTLLFVAVGIASVAQAQPGSRDNRDNRDDRDDRQTDQRNYDNGYDNDRDDVRNIPYDREDRFDHNSRFASERRWRMAIHRINQEYDFRIQRVKNSYYMSRFEKQRKVHFLEQKRQQEIRMLLMTAKKGKHNNGRDFPDNRRY